MSSQRNLKTVEKLLSGSNNPKSKNKIVEPQSAMNMTDRFGEQSLEGTIIPKPTPHPDNIKMIPDYTDERTLPNLNKPAQSVAESCYSWDRDSIDLNFGQEHDRKAKIIQDLRQHTLTSPEIRAASMESPNIVNMKA